MRKLVPATPSVIAWAIRESGYSMSALATLLHTSESEIESWTKGTHPELAKLQAFAREVKRPFSAFLLPHPPSATYPAVQFRSTSTAKRRALNPEERRRIREAVRLQGVLAWLSPELRVPAPRVPAVSTKDDPERVARGIRQLLNVPVEMQLSFSTASEALLAWREAVEQLGVTVLMLPMGVESCRGFSVWDHTAPLIAVNSAWLPEARVFTLIHELAHLSSRTNSACAEDVIARSHSGDRTERWCDRVAAAVLMPAEALADVLSELPGAKGTSSDLTKASQVATRFRVSRRAAALRLIEQDLAPWSLFKAFPPQGENTRTGGGGTGMTRVELRRQQYGQRTMGLFQSAVQSDVIGAADVVDYLDIAPDAMTTTPSRSGKRGGR